MYRPEGWKNPYHEETGRVPDEHNAEFQDYEAGADAMLEGLKKQNVTLPDIIHHYTLGKLGKLVFIPEEEADSE